MVKLNDILMTLLTDHGFFTERINTEDGIIIRFGLDNTSRYYLVSNKNKATIINPSKSIVEQVKEHNTTWMVDFIHPDSISELEKVLQDIKHVEKLHRSSNV